MRCLAMPLWAAVGVADAVGRSLELGVIAYNVAIHASDKGSRWSGGLATVAAMQQDGVQCDVVTFNSMLNLYRRCHHWQAGLAVLRVLPQVGLRPDAISCGRAAAAGVGTRPHHQGHGWRHLQTAGHVDRGYAGAGGDQFGWLRA